MNAIDEKKQHHSNYANSLQHFCDAVSQGEAGVSIYTNNYYGVHAQVLETIYPIVKSFLGEKIFSALAYTYAEHYPSTQWDINLYGNKFADFVAAQTQSSKANDLDWEFVATLAQIEYAIVQAYYDDDAQDTANTVYWVAPNQHPPEPELIVNLQEQHPYAQISQTLVFNQPIAIWRADLKIQISNHPPTSSSNG